MKHLCLLAVSISVTGLVAIACSGPEAPASVGPQSLVVASSQGTASLFECEEGILVSCTGKGPLVLYDQDLLQGNPELRHREIDVDVTLVGKFENTLNSVKVDVLTRGAAEPASSEKLAGSTRLGRTANLKPTVTVTAGDHVKVQLTTDIDNRRYNFSKKPVATVDTGSVAVSLRPSNATLALWKDETKTLADDIRDFTQTYINLERSVGTINLTRGDVDGLRSMAEDELGYLLEVAGYGLTLPDLVYPASHPDVSLRGLAKAEADMPQPAWRQTKASNENVEVMFKVYSRALLLTKDMSLVKVEDAQNMVVAAEGALRRRATRGDVLKKRLEKWAARLDEELRLLKISLEEALTKADAAVKKDGG